MLERLRKTTSRGNHKRAKALFLVFLLVVSIPAMTISLGGDSGIAAAQTDNSTEYYEDFENGTTDGWTAENENIVSVVNESFWGNKSVNVSDEGDPAAYLTWTDGQRFDTGDSFEITGTFNASGTTGSTGNVSEFGIIDDSKEKRAMMYIDHGTGEAYLATSHKDEKPDDTEPYTLGTWSEFRFQVSDGLFRAKIWEAGTDEPDNWQLSREFDEFEGEFVINAGNSNSGSGRRLLVDEVDAGANVLSGQVVDQNGDPVSNATVEAMGVDYDSLNDSIEDKQQRADELLEEAEDPLPDQWNSSLKLSGSGGHFDQAENEYVAVHTTDDWQLGGSQLPGTEYRLDVDPELQKPDLVAPNDETLILTVWDPTDTGGIIRDREDAADVDLSGRTTSGTIVIEQISPSGEVVDRMKRDTQEYVALNPSFSFSTKTHEAVAADLPNNHFYRIYPEGSEESAYVMARGSPSEMSHALTKDLTTEAGNLDEQAQSLRNQIEDGRFRRVTTTTNETGHYEIRTLRGVQTASVQAYKADGEILTSITGPSINDLRTAHERGYNGSVYISPAPTHVDVPNQNATIEVYKSPTPPFGPMAEYDNILDYLENELLDGSEARLGSMFEDELQNVDSDELKKRHEELRSLIESNEDLKNRLEELHDGELSDGDDSREELEAEISAMQRAIADLEEQLEAEPPETGIDNGEIHGTFPFAGELNEDAVTVLVHYQNGTSDIVGEDHWSIESSSILGGDQVVVDGYPLPEGAAVADLEVTGVSEDGRLGSSRASVVNPAFDGDIPKIDAIDVSTLRPGVNETVGLSVRSDDLAFAGVRYVTVYGPDGTELGTTTDSGRTTFAPSETGVHSVRVTYENQGGTQFVTTFRIQAKEQPTSDPPTVRVIEGIGGPTAIAGDQLESASVDVQDGTAEIMAQAPGDESPTNIDVRAEALTVDTIDLSVVSGSNEEAITNHVSVRLHTDFGTEETLVYRGAPSQPITESGETKFGAWETRENSEGDTHQVVQTYTDAKGEVTFDTSRNPSLTERTVYWLTVRTPIYLPLGGLAAVVVTPVDFLTSFASADIPAMTSITLTTTCPIEVEPVTTTLSSNALLPMAAASQGVTA